MDTKEIGSQLANLAADAAATIRRHMAAGGHPHIITDLQRIADMLSTLANRCQESADPRQ